MNDMRLAEITEERLAMKKCANIFCETPDVPDAISSKATKGQKFFIK